MNFKDIVKVFAIYACIAICYLFLNVARYLHVVYIRNRYISNMRNRKNDRNKDFEYAIDSLIKKAGLHRWSYVSDILETLPEWSYFNKYLDLFDDMKSRFRQKMKHSLLWPSLLSRYVCVHIFKRKSLHKNIIVKIFFWLASGIGNYFLSKLLELLF